MELDKSGLGVMPVLTIVFIILKLTSTINWSWWWVLSPLWIGAAIAALFLFIISVIAIFTYRG